MTPDEQLDQWVRGDSIHNTDRDECCPDFSCCFPAGAWPTEKREEFARKYRAGENVLPMLLDSLRALGDEAPATVRVVGTAPTEARH